MLGRLWNFQSAVKTVDTISAYASLQTLYFLALTETLRRPIHQSASQLNFVFTRSCRTSALYSTLLTVSNHQAVTFSLALKSNTSLTPTPHTVTTCRNLKSLYPSTLFSTVLSSLPSTDQLALMLSEEASSTLLSSFSLSLDALCLLRKLFSLFSPHSSTLPPTPLSMTLQLAFKESKLDQPLIYSYAHPESTSSTLTCIGLTCFSPLSSEDVLTLVMSNCATACSLDLFPSPIFCLLQYPAIPHHPDQFFRHLRHYSSSFQDSNSKATPKETHPRLC